MRLCLQGQDEGRGLGEPSGVLRVASAERANTALHPDDRASIRHLVRGEDERLLPRRWTRPFVQNCGNRVPFDDAGEHGEPSVFQQNSRQHAVRSARLVTCLVGVVRERAAVGKDLPCCLVLREERGRRERPAGMALPGGSGVTTSPGARHRRAGMRPDRGCGVRSTRQRKAGPLDSDDVIHAGIPDHDGLVRADSPVPDEGGEGDRVGLVGVEFSRRKDLVEVFVRLGAGESRAHERDAGCAAVRAESGPMGRVKGAQGQFGAREGLDPRPVRHDRPGLLWEDSHQGVAPIEQESPDHPRLSGATITVGPASGYEVWASSWFLLGILPHPLGNPKPTAATPPC